MPKTSTTSRILVVEDEPLVALDIEAMIREFGISDVDVANTIDDAHSLLDTGQAFETALLDFNVGGQSVVPVAERLLEAGVRMIFTSGYSLDASILDRFSARHLQKPIMPDALEAAMVQKA